MEEEKVSINWFPGHMHKTLREIEEKLKAVDAIIYVLDARAPISSFNPKIDRLAQNKPIVYCLNKADLADEIKTKFFKQKLESENKSVVVLSANTNSAKTAILKAIKTALAAKTEAYSKKGINRVLRVMVVGVPNTGKSTIINLLAEKKKAETGNKPGVTKATAWVKVSDNLEILDTPGTLWPKFETNEQAVKLAMLGSIKDDAIDIASLGLEAIKMLALVAPEALIKRYNLAQNAGQICKIEPLEIMEEIAKNKGYLLKKSEIDYERTAKAVLTDYRSSRIGKISLD